MKEEVKNAIMEPKNDKSVGSDGLPAEIIRCGGNALVQYMKVVIEKRWEQREIATEWNIGIICPLHKKRNSLETQNYRGIALLNEAYKILSNILYARLQPFVEEKVGEYQKGQINYTPHSG